MIYNINNDNNNYVLKWKFAEIISNDEAIARLVIV